MKKLNDEGRSQVAAECDALDLQVEQRGGADFLVGRDRLVNQVLGCCRDPSIVFVCAPKGFGKTALLLQCASAVRDDPACGSAVLMGAESLDGSELVGKMEGLLHDADSSAGTVILIDDLPLVPPDGAALVIERMRALRSEGCSLIVACTPANRSLVQAMGDSHKIGAQALRVQPREYARWARTFSISSTLDVYDLTQGIPALVAALRAVSKGTEGTVHLDARVEDVYRSALQDMERKNGAAYLLARLFVLLGNGAFGDFERSGIRVKSEVLRELVREYPIFNIDMEARAFSCLGVERDALKRLRMDVVRESTGLLKKTIRIQLRARRVDEAVELMRTALAREEALEIISQFPLVFALFGQARFVRVMLAGVDPLRAVSIDIGLVVALYAASLVAGEYRSVRAASRELCRRAQEIERDVSPFDWGCALALRRVWASCSGISLPQLSDRYVRSAESPESRALLRHAEVYGELVGGTGAVAEPAVHRAELALDEGRVDVGFLLNQLDAALAPCLHGGVLEVRDDDAALRRMADDLVERRLEPLSTRVRMVAAVRRLFAGLPIVDERALSDAGTVAVRESDLATQLFCLVAEGWQALSLGQVVNAQFRGQQVLKLVEPGQRFIRSWAQLLERTASLLNDSRAMIRGEAEALDLSSEVAGPTEAWLVALHLSAARFDSDLSAWFSLHKEILLDEGFRLRARLAIAMLGERADPLRRLIPASLAMGYGLDAEPKRRERPLFEVVGSGIADIGQVNINLFGGFHVERNGHVVTDMLWRRKKAGVLAARLVLNLGTFVSRDVIIEEMWPDSELARARQNLYTALSTLKSAFQQKADGPQYLLTQGDGIALNSEFIASDVMRFDLLAREVLLKRVGTSPRSIVETCLKLEEIYAGPLFVPNVASTGLFARERRAYESKYVDCLVRGIDAALEEEDLSAASWLADAALKQAPAREDVLRRAMKTLGIGGRRREVADLYGAHLYYLKNELRCEPEAETRRVYEEIVNESGRRVYL